MRSYRSTRIQRQTRTVVPISVASLGTVSNYVVSFMGQALPQGVSYSRTGPASVSWADGHISYVAANSAPFSDLGAFSEVGSINLLPYSQDLTNASGWSGANATASAGSVVGRDNVNNLQLITAGVTAGNRVRNNAVTVVSGQVYVASFDVAAGSSQYAGVVTESGAASGGAIFNLSGAGSVVNAVGTVLAQGIALVAPGIYRIWYVVTTTSTSLRIGVGVSSGSGYALSTFPNGANGSTINAGYAQIEPVATSDNTPTSFIQTTTTAQTRGNPSYQWTDARALAASSFVVQTTAARAAQTGTILGINALVGLGKTSGNTLTTEFGGNQTTTDTADWTTPTRSAVSFNASPNVSIALNGGTVVNAANSPPTISSLYLGSKGGSSAFLNGFLQQAAAYR